MTAADHLFIADAPVLVEFRRNTARNEEQSCEQYNWQRPRKIAKERKEPAIAFHALRGGSSQEGGVEMFESGFIFFGPSLGAGLPLSPMFVWHVSWAELAPMQRVVAMSLGVLCRIDAPCWFFKRPPPSCIRRWPGGVSPNCCVTVCRRRFARNVALGGAVVGRCGAAGGRVSLRNTLAADVPFATLCQSRGLGLDPWAPWLRTAALAVRWVYLGGLVHGGCALCLAGLAVRFGAARCVFIPGVPGLCVGGVWLGRLGRFGCQG